MFRSYNNTSEHFLSDYVAIVTKPCYFHVWRYHVIFTYEDIMFMRELAHLVFDWFLHNEPVYCPLTKLSHVRCVGV